MIRTIATFLTLVAICLAPPIAARAISAPDEQIWLAVSDVHLNIFDRSPQPSPYTEDSNVALFESALRWMHRTVPTPAVVLLPGDFLMHQFRQHVRRREGTPDAAAIRSMRWIAESFERAFPKAQFAIAMGNNDVPCGDYQSDDDSAYMRALARVWSPLVDRDGASPDFESSFARGGYYTARLPVRNLRLIVLNTVLFSREYRGDCGADAYHAASEELAWLRAVLRAAPSGTRNVVMMHIPPGFDAFSTDYARGFLAWPFLKPRYNAPLVGVLAAPVDRVAYAVAGHTHHFDFRLDRRVPVVVFGSLSPIYSNDPAFYALRVSQDGSLRDIDEYAFDDQTQRWLAPHSFDRTWGLQRIDAPSLSRLHERLAEVPADRAVWDRQANGWPSDPDAARGVWGGGSWRVSWCAQALLVADFARCARIERRIQGLHLLIAAIVAVAGLTILVAFLRARRARSRAQY